MVSIEKCELFDDDLVSFFEEEFHCIIHEKNEAVPLHGHHRGGFVPIIFRTFQRWLSLTLTQPRNLACDCLRHLRE